MIKSNATSDESAVIQVTFVLAEGQSGHKRATGQTGAVECSGRVLVFLSEQ